MDPSDDEAHRSDLAWRNFGDVSELLKRDDHLNLLKEISGKLDRVVQLLEQSALDRR